MLLPSLKYVGPNPEGVAFIPMLETFKKWTSVTYAIRSGNPITAVNTALQTHLQGSPYGDRPTRDQALNPLGGVPRTYVTNHPNDPGTKGVKRLLHSIMAEAAR